MKEAIFSKFKNSTSFYRSLLEKASSFDGSDLTSKSMLLESQKLFPPFGNFTDQTAPVTQIYKTSGTSGSPLLLTFSASDIDYITDIGKESFCFCGMGALGNREIVINCLNLSMWAGGFLDSQSMLKTGVKVINFGTGQTTELIELITSLTKSTFKISLHCTPSYLSKINARLMDKFAMQAADLNLHVLYLGGEAGAENNEFRAKLENRWKSQVYNANYGMSEVCSVMGSASKSNRLRFSPLYLANYYNELSIDDNPIGFEKVKEGDEGNLIISTLKKQSQPLFRYNTKERIRITEIRGKEMYFEIVGRSDDMLVFKGVNIFPEQFRAIVSRYKELTGIYKIVAKKEDGMINEITLVCELNAGFASTEKSLSSRIFSDISEHFSISINVQMTGHLDSAGNKHKILEYV